MALALIDPVSIKRTSPRKITKRVRDSKDDIKQLTTYKKLKLTKRINYLDVKHKDLLMVTEYNDDILKYLYSREKQIGSTDNYMRDLLSPYNFGPSMRAILIDWLIEVHQRFHYVQETLLLAIAIMDKFLSQNLVTVSRLQLLAVTSLFIAAKYEEIKLPKLSNYSYITDGAASAKDIKKAEAYILKSLRFDISIPNPLNFLSKSLESGKSSSKTVQMAKYILEHVYCCPHFIHLKPSQASKLSIYLAKQINNESLENETKEYTDEFMDSFEELVQEISQPSTNLEALFGKYKEEINGKIFQQVKDWCITHVTESKRDDPH